jgi:hypothetical protein
MTTNVAVEPLDAVDAVDVPLPAAPDTSQHEINVLRFGNSQGRMWLGELNTIRWAWDKQVALWKDDIAQNPERWTVEALMETVEAFGDMFIKETSE